jgi:chromosome segregation ATPase
MAKVKYCPKCGCELDVIYKCSRCKWTGPALVGKNNEILKEVKKMEEDISNEERLRRAEEELRETEKAVAELEPLRTEYMESAKSVRKLVREAEYKLSRLKEVAGKIEEVGRHVDKELWEEIMREDFESKDRVVIDYLCRGWEHRVLGLIVEE